MKLACDFLIGSVFTNYVCLSNLRVSSLDVNKPLIPIRSPSQIKQSINLYYTTNELTGFYMSQALVSIW